MNVEICVGRQQEGLFVEWQITHYSVLDSTNLEAKRMIQQQMIVQSKPTLHGTVLVAETQIDGKGRLNRQWVSQPGTGLWFTVILKPNLPIAQASLYSFVVAVSVAEAIRELYDLAVTLKWPNDVLLHGKKLCGILLELVSCTPSVYYLVVGIGVNVNQMLMEFPQELQEKASSIAIALGKTVDSMQLLSVILERLEENCSLFETQGFAPIRSKWKKQNCVIGQEVSVQIQGQTEYIGIVDDLAMDGTLVVRTADSIRTVVAGDVSLRTKEGNYTF